MIRGFLLSIVLITILPAQPLPPLVLALYETGYGDPEHWPAAPVIAPGAVGKFSEWQAPHDPLIGPYVSQDAEVLALHAGACRLYGLDGWVVPWRGRGSHSARVLSAALEAAHSRGLRVAVLVDLEPAALGGGSEAEEELTQDLVDLVDLLALAPAALRLPDGRVPLFVPSRLVSRRAEGRFWEDVLARIAELIPPGAALLPGSSPARSGLPIAGLWADGLAETYLVAAENAQADPLAAALERQRATLEQARGTDLITVAVVLPGYDGRWLPEPRGLIPRGEAGATYHAFWRQALAQEADWVLVDSWNDWPRGTEIEPSSDAGFDAARVTAMYAERFRAIERPLVREDELVLPRGTEN